MFRLFVLVFLSLTLALPAAAQDTPAPDASQVQWTEYVTGLARPIYLTSAFDGSGRLFVLEQAGKIRLIIDGVLQDTPFLDLSGLSSQDILSGYSERGLLGLAFHPNFAENGQFFIHYSDRSGGTVIARYQVSADDPNLADPNSGEILFTHSQPYPNHNGGQIAFGPDGYLYIALGDGGSAGDPQNNAQNPSVLLGKILRIDVDNGSPYAIPDDNPINTVNPNLAPEVWAWGLRNPYRFSFDQATGNLYIADVGQNQWEEINFQPAGSPGGQNYGWRVFEGNHPYSGEADPGGTVAPVAEYSHSNGCSVTGGYVYRGDSLPAMQGVYLYGDWCSGNIWALYPDAQATWQNVDFMSGTGMAISAFGQDEAGEMYVADYGGRILKLTASQ
ncbi:MAG: PQQ-dependent sugar dehydrogenase [Anaerolineae bacterium]|nr:PQQ-dependent sugar dehydrogenase [Anaerolineae bacterium]